MSEIPSDLRYTEDHEYLGKSDEEDIYTVGITDFAQGELGDIVYLELPGVGESFAKGETFGTVEAVKAVSDLFMPAGGEVVAVNEALADDPSLVNSDPYGGGWMIRVRLNDASEIDSLLGAEAYAKHTE